LLGGRLFVGAEHPDTPIGAALERCKLFLVERVLSGHRQGLSQQLTPDGRDALSTWAPSSFAAPMGVERDHAAHSPNKMTAARAQIRMNE
jgi:hypothetical protein